MDLISGLDPASLPDWADPRLAVRVSGEGDTVFVIDGNPHTYRGLVRLYDVTARESLSVQPSRISEATEFARGWLAGFLHGNEPDGPTSAPLDDLRGERERALFHTYQQKLPIERRGEYAVHAVRETDGTPLMELSRAVSRVFTALAAKYPLWQHDRWLPVTDDHAVLPALSLTTDHAVESAFAWLNPGYAVAADELDQQCELRVVNDGFDATPAGIIEVIVTVCHRALQVHRLEFVVNVEHPERIGAPDDVVADILTTVIEHLDPDAASAAQGVALLEAQVFSICPPDIERDPTVPVVAGWLTYVAARLGADLSGLSDLPFGAHPTGGGTLLRYLGAPTDLTVAIANQLAAALESDCDDAEAHRPA